MAKPRVQSLGEIVLRSRCTADDGKIVWPKWGESRLSAAEFGRKYGFDVRTNSPRHHLTAFADFDARAVREKQTHTAKWSKEQKQEIAADVQRRFASR
jgi:hypothetical protein